MELDQLTALFRAQIRLAHADNPRLCDLMLEFLDQEIERVRKEDAQRAQPC